MAIRKEFVNPGSALVIYLNEPDETKSDKNESLENNFILIWNLTMWGRSFWKWKEVKYDIKNLNTGSNDKVVDLNKKIENLEAANRDVLKKTKRLCKNQGKVIWKK